MMSEEDFIKIIIAGGRDFTDQDKGFPALDDLLLQYDMENGDYFGAELVEVVCGEARGADTLGKEWAILRGASVKSFPADWDKHGRAAGPIRNGEMADYADILVAFWDGKTKGTKNMIDQALSKGLEVHIYRY